MRISTIPIPCEGSHPVQRTADTCRPLMKEMSIDHHRFDVAMQQLLTNSNVRSVFKWVRDKRIAECKARSLLNNQYSRLTPNLVHHVTSALYGF